MNKSAFSKSGLYQSYLFVVYLLDIFINFFIISTIAVEFKEWIFPKALVVVCGEFFPTIAVCFIIFLSLIYAISLAYIFCFLLCKGKNILNLLLTMILLIKNFLFLLLQGTVIP